MAAPRITLPTRPNDQASLDKNTPSRARSPLVRHVADWMTSAAYPWCKDHVVSVTLLLAFPVSIGMYYGTRPETEPAPLPHYLKAERNAETLAPPPAFPKLDSPMPSKLAPRISAHPDQFNSPNVVDAAHLTFADASQEVDAVPPLPIAVDHPKPISRANEAPMLAWPGLNTPPETPASPIAQSVWLTGSIEAEDNVPRLMQNPSRVHELTMPSRN